MAARYQPYPDYKDSGVEWLGDVPNNWLLSRLKFESLINMGQSPNSDDCNQDGLGLPFLQGNAEFGDKYPSPKQFCEIPRKIADEGDLLFSVRAPVGALNIADQKYGIGRGLCAISNSASLSHEFLWWLIPVVRSELDAVSTGSTFEAVSVEQVQNVTVFKPTLIEQQKIADFLDHETAKIDTLIEKQQQLITLLKEKRQAVISHAVTKGLNPDAPMRDSGVEWLGEVPEHWEVKRVRHVFNIENNLRTPIDRQSRIEMEGEYRYFGPTGVLNLIDRYNVEGMYFLLGEDGDHFLKFKEKSMTILVDGQFNVNNHAHLLRSKTDILTKWGCLYFEHKDLFPWLIKQGVGRYKLQKTVLSDIPVVVPPESEQQFILKEIDKKKHVFSQIESRAESLIIYLNEKRAALISAAVTGKIDVRNWQPPKIATNETEEAAA